MVFIVEERRQLPMIKKNNVGLRRETCPPATSSPPTPSADFAFPSYAQHTTPEHVGTKKIEIEVKFSNNKCGHDEEVRKKASS